MRSVKNQIKDAKNYKAAADLKAEGYTHVMIAAELGITTETAKVWINRGLEEYRGDVIEATQRHVAIAQARYDRFMRTWDRLAHGYTIRLRSGKLKRVLPDKEAAHLWLRAMRDYNHLMTAGQTQRVELTGPAGGPVVTAALDEMEAARLIREMFGDAAAKNPPTDAEPEVKTQH